MDDRQGQDNTFTNSVEEARDTNTVQSPLQILADFVFRIGKDLIETILPALVIAFLVTHFLGERTVVFGQSMEPNLYQNQQLIIDKLSYRFHEPKRGDIVVIEVNNSDIPYIKRVVGLPGESLEVRNNRVYINGEVFSESYILEVNQGDFGPVTIQDDHIFVMGDNRRYSRDSRSVGTTPLEDVIAKAWFRIWPLDDFGLLK